MSEEVKLAEAIANVYMERQALLDQLHATERERNDLREEVDRLGAELRSALADAMQAWEQAGSDRADLNTALHNATYMTAKVAEIDAERLALLDRIRLAASHLPGRPDLAEAALSEIVAAQDER